MNVETCKVGPILYQLLHIVEDDGRVMVIDPVMPPR